MRRAGDDVTDDERTGSENRLSTLTSHAAAAAAEVTV